jgi:CRISPR/Cas system-associated exonuclease Cas4 (RecB family)
MAKIDHLSWSQVDLYLKCPREYWFRYVRYPELRKTFTTPAMELGTHYHKAVENLYNGMPLKEALSQFDDATTPRKGSDDVVNIRKAIEYYYNYVIPRYKHLAFEVEQEVKDFYIDGIPVPFEMRIDLILIDDRVIDHKTTSKFRGDVKAEGNKQMLIYAYRHFRKTGRIPRRMELHKAFKEDCTDRVEIDSASVELYDMFKVVDLVKNVYKMIEMDIFPCTLHSTCATSPFKDEWDQIILKQR